MMNDVVGTGSAAHDETWIAYYLVPISALLCIVTLPPINAKLLAWFAFVPLFYCVFRSCSWIRAGLKGMCWGFLYYGVLALFLWQWKPWVYFFFVLSLSVGFGLLSALLFWFDRQFERYLFRLISPPAIWVLFLFVSGFTPAGSHWLLIGDFQPVPLRGFLPLGGSSLVMGMIILVNSVVTGWFRFGKRPLGGGVVYRTGGIVLFLLAAGPVYHLYLARYIRPEPVRRRVVLLLQPELEHNYDWRRNNTEEILNQMRSLLVRTREDTYLAVWPEYDLPGTMKKRKGRFPYYRIRELSLLHDVPVVMGLWEGENELKNVARMALPDGTWSASYVTPNPPPFRRQKPGEAVITMTLEDSSFGVLLCYDDTRPEVPRKMVNAGAEFLAALANDMQFIGTQQPLLHLERTRVVAATFHRTVLRSIPSGYSSVIGPDGSITDVNYEGESYRIWPRKKMGVNVEVPLYEFRTIYARWGDWPAALALVLLILMGFMESGFFRVKEMIWAEGSETNS